MMMIPSRNDFDLFNDMFRDPFFNEHETRVMKADIREKKDKYSIDIDLPGYSKENIKISVEDGYLTVRRERYTGSCSRSFYVGEDVESEDIKASFKNGILNLEIPKKEEKKLPEKKYIQIDE